MLPQQRAEAIPQVLLMAEPWSKVLRQQRAEAIPQAQLLAAMLPVLCRRVRAAPTTNSSEKAAHHALGRARARPLCSGAGR